MRGALLALFLLLAMAACGAPTRQAEAVLTGEEVADANWTMARQQSEPRIQQALVSLQCVPFARETSGVRLQGDAWRWWERAMGRYERSHRPEVGAVLVMSRTPRLRSGHLAVVTKVVNDREILVRHANWLNEGQIHEDMPVRDVSLDNDWSVVNVWYLPAESYGLRNYAVSGFILPHRT